MRWVLGVTPRSLDRARARGLGLDEAIPGLSAGLLQVAAAAGYADQETVAGVKVLRQRGPGQR